MPFPFFSTMALDLAGLKLILAQEMSFSRPWRIHLPPGTIYVVIVRSSLKALMGLLSSRLGQKPSALSFSCLDHHIHGNGEENNWDGAPSHNPLIELVANWCCIPRSDSKPEVPIVVQDKVLDLIGYMVSVQGSFDQLVGYWAIYTGEAKPKHN